MYSQHSTFSMVQIELTIVIKLVLFCGSLVPSRYEDSVVGILIAVDSLG